jgi:tRNA nucleotidyltransferase (CCA-adding enzyme)
MSAIEVYVVGGAVRDALMGKDDAYDLDWVVVGATPEHMSALGFVPVGSDFPVFLHPATGQEFALARTERKTAKGYQGFSFHAAPDVTLAQDLARRDLSVNAMAMAAPSNNLADAGAWRNWRPPVDGALIDPFNGLADVRAGVLRHVSPAFAEDPVRILRLARFAARWPTFSVDASTTQLMCDMVAHGEVDALVAERVWQELSRGLMAAKPSRMFEVLRSCGALRVLLPELDRLWGVPQRADYHPEVDTGVHAMMVMDMSAQLQADIATRFACLCHDLGKGTTPAHVLPRHTGHEMRSVQLLKGVAQRFKVPKACKELADVVAKEHGHIHRCNTLSAPALVRLLERCDAFRRPERFASVLLACECDARGRLGLENQAYTQAPWLLSLQQAAAGIDTQAIAAAATQAPEFAKQQGAWIASQIAAAREQAIAHLL